MALLNASDVGIPAADPTTTLHNVLNTAYFIAGFVAVLVLIIAGLTYIISSGNAGTVAKAKNAITYAVVGLVVIILAFVITQFVIGRF